MKRICYGLFLIVFGVADLKAQRQQPEDGQSRNSRFGRQMDADGDGKISREEFPGPKETFDQFDKDKDNFLSNDVYYGIRDPLVAAPEFFENRKISRKSAENP